MDDVVAQVNFVNQFELTPAITDADISEGESHIFLSAIRQSRTYS